MPQSDPPPADIDPLVLSVLGALIDASTGPDSLITVPRLRKALEVRQSVLNRVLSALAEAGLVTLIDRPDRHPAVRLSDTGVAWVRDVLPQQAGHDRTPPGPPRAPH